MTLEEQETLAQQLERAAEILRSQASPAEKVNTLERVGGLATFKGEKWGEKLFQEMLDNLT